MTTLPTSLELRARIIADESARPEYVGDLERRVRAVEAVALAQLRQACGEVWLRLQDKQATE